LVYRCKSHPKNIDSFRYSSGAPFGAVTAEANGSVGKELSYLKGSGPDAPSARRLRALMWVLGFDGRGAQVRFAEEIGVGRSRLNNVLVGYPLSRQLAQKIMRRYPRVSMEFLLLGKSGGNLDRALRQQLLDYERKTGISVFDS
jgi:hypothetical protein